MLNRFVPSLHNSHDGPQQFLISQVDVPLPTAVIRIGEVAQMRALLGWSLVDGRPDVDD